MKIWILNHYAANMYFDKLGRHQSIANYLIKEGHEVKIFCSNILHNSDKCIQLEKKLSITKKGDGEVPYVFVKTSSYDENGLNRIKNMISFMTNVKKVIRHYINIEGKPDVFIASSVHPLTLVAGIQLSRKYKIPCICEMRDLWPEVFVASGKLKRNGIFARLLYRGEKWIYQKADHLIYTMPGGYDYIEDRGLNGIIPKSKVSYINNGVDLYAFDNNIKLFKVEDKQLSEQNVFKVIYVGSIRYINHLEDIVNVAKNLRDRGVNDIKFFIYGEGPDRQRLIEKCTELKLKNIYFKGRVEKKFVPYILSKGNLNIVNGIIGGFGTYGVSWNKLFEYMASGKPAIANYQFNKYNFIQDYKFGIAKQFNSIEEFSEQIMKIANLSDNDYQKLCKNARIAANDFDFANLTKKLISVIEFVLIKK